MIIEIVWVSGSTTPINDFKEGVDKIYESEEEKAYIMCRYTIPNSLDSINVYEFVRWGKKSYRVRVLV